MTFGNSNYGISASASCDTNASFSSVAEEQKRRSESLDMDEIVGRSNKRKKVCTNSSQSSRQASPIKTHGPFPGYSQSWFVGNVPFAQPQPPTSTARPSKRPSC